MTKQSNNVSKKDSGEEGDTEEMIRSLRKQRGTAEGRLTMKVKLFDEFISQVTPVARSI